MTLALIDPINDCSFNIKFADESKLEKVKELAVMGLGIWYQAAHPTEEIEPNEYFSVEEIEGYYWEGYAQPTSDLLDRFGIEHEITDLEYEDDNETLKCDEYIYY